MDVFLGGTGKGKRRSRARVAEKFSQDEWSPNSPVCVIYYMLNSGGFVASCLQSIAKGGSSIIGYPGQTREMFQASTTRSSGYDFLCTCGLCCHMLYVYYMIYACCV